MHRFYYMSGDYYMSREHPQRSCGSPPGTVTRVTRLWQPHCDELWVRGYRESTFSWSGLELNSILNF